MRLADPSVDEVGYTKEGTLEVCINNAWGGVCSDIQFGNTEMAVACRHIGFSAQSKPVLNFAHTIHTLYMNTHIIYVLVDFHDMIHCFLCSLIGAIAIMLLHLSIKVCIHYVIIFQMQLFSLRL